MKSIIITGSAGLIGSESTRHFANDGFRVVGIDNDMRSRFFGPEASTGKIRDQLVREISQYEHYDIDIRDASAWRISLRKIGEPSKRSCTRRRSRHTTGPHAIHR